MERKKIPLIVVDPGHGGQDNGAVYQGRYEKNDNLALGLVVQANLLKQGLNVLMTRETDVQVSLQERVLLANNAGADLFVSIHRNSFTENTSWTKGVSNHIYMTAPEETSGRAARYVLDEIVRVGVQRNAGIFRDNFYVLRNTLMPAMLLEMGYIINEIDNQLFDKHLVGYGEAITKGVMKYFNIGSQITPPVTPPVSPPVTPEPPGSVPGGCPVPIDRIGRLQREINERFKLNMNINGKYDLETRNMMTRALQMSLNKEVNAGLVVDGIIGPRTIAAIPSVSVGSRGDIVFVVQALLLLNTYNPGIVDGAFGVRTQLAVQLFQSENNLLSNGIATSETTIKLLGC